MTLREAALTRWLKTRHITAEYSEAFKAICTHAKDDTAHKELGAARMSRDYVHMALFLV